MPQPTIHATSLVGASQIGDKKTRRVRANCIDSSFKVYRRQRRLAIYGNRLSLMQANDAPPGHTNQWNPAAHAWPPFHAEYAPRESIPAPIILARPSSTTPEYRW